MYFPSIVIPSNLPVPFTTCQVPSAFAASPFRAYTPKNLSPAAFTCSHAPNEAMSTINTTNEREFEAEVYRAAGEIALKSRESDAAKAEAYFERALSVARQQQAKSWELRAAMSLARLWRDQGKRDEARDFSLRCTAGSLKGLTRSI